MYNRLMDYNWQQPDWPDFRYDLKLVEIGVFRQTGKGRSIHYLIREDI